MLLLSLLPDCVFMHGIQSLLSMKELLVLACASKRMSNCTASAIKEKVDRDARFLPFAEALMERVKVHTGLSIPFSIDRFRRIPPRPAARARRAGATAARGRDRCGRAQDVCADRTQDACIRAGGAQDARSRA